MKVEVRLFGEFREVVGSEAITVEVPKGASCEDVLRRLAELEPRLEELLFSEGVLRDHLHVFVNGENVNHREGLKTKLSDGDVLTFFTPISGG
jgi:molybdopterin synthase sulfur carrier subunit